MINKSSSSWMTLINEFTVAAVAKVRWLNAVMRRSCEREGQRGPDSIQTNPLSSGTIDVSFWSMKLKWNQALPVLLMVVFALTRWPGLMPLNFSAAYALAFCAGVYFPGRLAWSLPLGILVVSDVALNCYYYFALHIDSFQAVQLVNYLSYVIIIALGRKFNARGAWWKLVGGGILGACWFYLVTNTASWFLNPFQNPEYTKSLSGWIVALTKGTAGYPATWEFFRNTLLSGGLFTGLFSGAIKLADKIEEAEAGEPEGAGEAEAEEA